MKRPCFRVAIYFFLIPLITLSAGGCATTGQGSSAVEKNLAVSPLLRFDDIPVPAGFSQLSKESFIFQTESVRAGVLRYEGKAGQESVMQFYKQNMPVYNWQPINTIEFGLKQMSFEKPGQNCIVVIEGNRTKSTITISVGPKSEKPKSPLK
ncbi:MAG: hypothetical protein WC317_01660 [Candidatus Omnitrophota bacterium]|jgi:hypothetical protein